MVQNVFQLVVPLVAVSGIPNLVGAKATYRLLMCMRNRLLGRVLRI